MLGCSRTHLLGTQLATFGTVHLAVSSLGCKRLQAGTALMTPLLAGQEALVQLLADLRWDTLATCCYHFQLLLPFSNSYCL